MDGLLKCYAWLGEKKISLVKFFCAVIQNNVILASWMVSDGADGRKRPLPQQFQSPSEYMFGPGKKNRISAAQRVKPGLAHDILLPEAKGKIASLAIPCTKANQIGSSISGSTCTIHLKHS